jgi:hypothetical protein
MRENGDDAGAAKVLAAKAQADSERFREGTGFGAARLSLGSFPMLIALPLILAMLLVIAGPYFLRRNQEGASDGRPTLPLLRAALENYHRNSAGQRRVEHAENERPTEMSTSIEAGRVAGVGQSVDKRAVFKRKGEFWTIAYGAANFRLKDVKGLAYMAFLLAHPGERIHVHELIARVDGVADKVSDLLRRPRVETARPTTSVTQEMGSISTPTPIIVGGFASWLRSCRKLSGLTIWGAQNASSANRSF